MLQVNSSFTMKIIDKNDNQQQMTIAGLDFETMQDNFNNGKLHIVCQANVFHLYQKTADVLLKEERPRLASVLGTRESSYMGRYFISYYFIKICKLKAIYSIKFQLFAIKFWFQKIL